MVGPEGYSTKLPLLQVHIRNIPWHFLPPCLASNFAACPQLNRIKYFYDFIHDYPFLTESWSKCLWKGTISPAAPLEGGGEPQTLPLRAAPDPTLSNRALKSSKGERSEKNVLLIQTCSSLDCHMKLNNKRRTRHTVANRVIPRQSSSGPLTRRLSPLLHRIPVPSVLLHPPPSSKVQRSFWRFR